MKRSLVRRAAALFILSILSAAPWSAAESRQDHKAVSPLLSRAWSQLTALWSDIGCIIDPSGACHGSAGTQGEIGCGIDPSGGCSH